MSETRRQWVETLERYRRNAERPDNDRYWSTALDTASADELRAIQSAKLRMAVRYVYEHIL